MQNAKQFIQDRMEAEEINEPSDTLKVEINSMLLCNLPEHITIKQANAISECIHLMITGPDWFFGK